MRILLVLIFSVNIYAHDLSHTWLGDKAAYKSVKKYDHSKVSKSGLKNLLFVEKSFLEEKLAQYSGAKPVEINGKMERISERRSDKGRTLARAFLKQEYEKLGYEVSTHEYGTLFRKGSNFIAQKEGDDNTKTLILSSHIDSVNNSGANDDGTGTIAALAIAKALANLNLKYNLRILGFDQEEIGLVGSAQYVKTLQPQTIVGDIQLEMMGTNSRKDGAFHVIDCDKKHSTFLTDAIAQGIADIGAPISINKACTNRSDHASFWKENMPAVVISENFFGGDSDPCYHKKCDVLDERIDFDYMTHITNAIANAVKDIQEAI